MLPIDTREQSEERDDRLQVIAGYHVCLNGGYGHVTAISGFPSPVAFDCKFSGTRPLLVAAGQEPIV